MTLLAFNASNQQTSTLSRSFPSSCTAPLRVIVLPTRFASSPKFLACVSSQKGTMHDDTEKGCETSPRCSTLQFLAPVIRDSKGLCACRAKEKHATSSRLEKIEKA